MQNIQVADLKARFSEIIKAIENEEQEFVIQYGRQHKKVAVLIPYKAYQKTKQTIKLGILENVASYQIKDDFELDEASFLGLENK